MKKICKNCQHYWNVKNINGDCILPKTKNKNNLNKEVKEINSCNEFMQSQWN